MNRLSDIYAAIGKDSKAEFLARPSSALRYGRFQKNLRGCCSLFDEHRLNAGDRVLIVTRDEDVAITVFVAAMLDGKVPVMLAPDTAEARISAIHDSVTPALVVTDSERRGEKWTKSAIFTFVPQKARLLNFDLVLKKGPVFNLKTVVAGREPLLPDDPESTAYILFTSGTTQAPSGVKITQRNLIAQLRTISRLFDITAQSRIFNGMVLAHSDGLVQGPLLALANGCTLIRPMAFSVPGIEEWLNSVRSFGATHFITVPTIYMLIDRYAQHDDYFDDESCKYLISVAAKLENALWERLQEKFGRPVYNEYGLTETVVSGLYAGPHPEMGPVGTIGLPVDVKARLRTVDNQPVENGAVGELQMKGENVIRSYWQNPDRDAEAFTEDGWFRTGDLAVLRPDGAYEISGRLKSVIMSGGLLINPEEIDEILAAHPNVIEAATVGLPDENFQEVPVSAVVLDSEILEVDLTEHCRKSLESLKVPKRIIAVESIPRGDARKPILNELRSILSLALVSETGNHKNETRALEEGILTLAAQIFRVPKGELSLSSSPDSVAGWDSFSQVNLILGAEDNFSVRIPTSKVAGTRSLRDLAKVIEELM